MEYLIGRLLVEFLVSRELILLEITYIQGLGKKILLKRIFQMAQSNQRPFEVKGAPYELNACSPFSSTGLISPSSLHIQFANYQLESPRIRLPSLPLLMVPNFLCLLNGLL